MAGQFQKLFRMTSLRRQVKPFMMGQSAQQNSLQTGSIAIMSIPPGARIFIDDNDTRVNSSAIVADIDSTTSHTLKLVLDGYQYYIDDALIVSDGSIDIYPPILMVPISPPTGTGNLNVTSIPDGVEFRVTTMSTTPETEIIDVAPTTISDIPAGLYKYEAAISGPPDYSDTMGTFEIVAGQTTDLNISLTLYDPALTPVLIESIPPGADIYIDGSLLSAKTSFLGNFNEDTHTYELRKLGYQTKTGSFTPVLDIPNIVSETLQHESGIGTNILIAGVATIGIMMMSSKSK